MSLTKKTHAPKAKLDAANNPIVKTTDRIEVKAIKKFGRVNEGEDFFTSPLNVKALIENGTIAPSEAKKLSKEVADKMGDIKAPAKK